VKKKEEVPRDVGHPEVGPRMSSGPHPPGIYSPGSKVPEPSRRGRGAGKPYRSVPVT
jgi:hypothetical protein